DCGASAVSDSPLTCVFQAEDGIRDFHVTGVQTCALPIYVGKYFKNSVQFNDISERDRVSFARNAGGAASSLFEVNTGSEISKNNTLNLDKRFVESSLGAASTDSSQLDQSMINNSSSAHQRLSNNYDLSNVQNSMRESKEEIDEEIRSTKAAIAYNKERLARPNTTPEFR